MGLRSLDHSLSALLRIQWACGFVFVCFYNPTNYHHQLCLAHCAIPSPSSVPAVSQFVARPLSFFAL